MEYKEIFLKVIEKEMSNFVHDVSKHSTFEFESTALFTENFDTPYNRCFYLSRYANTCFYIFKASIEKFLSDCPDAKSILSEWKSHAEVKVCSLSTGPGLDYFAFMLSILEYDQLSPNFNGAKVISKYGAWQDTANFLLEVLREKNSVCGIPWSKFNYNIEVIQTDDLLKCFSEKTNIKNEHLLLRNTHIVLMMRTLNLYAFGLQQETSILQMLQELISSLRSDATIVCVDTIPSLALFNQALSCFPGKFLYGPIHQTCKIPVHIFEGEKWYPETHFNGTFFVWRKLPFTLTKFTSLEMTLLDTDCKRKKPITVYGISANGFTANSSRQNFKTSEILPWRELPLCKIPWGKIFWQNASLATKKSLGSVMSLKKESLERHWIGEVANLYMKEFGTPKFSILSEEAEKEVVIKTSNECSKESSQIVTEILSIPNILMATHSSHILKDVTCNDGTNNTECMILGENSLDIVPSSPSSNVLNAMSEFNLEPMKHDLTMLEKYSLVQDSYKEEIPISEALKLNTSDANFINDASPIEVTSPNTETEIEGMVCKAGRNSKTPSFKLCFSTANKSTDNLKTSEILPWRKLPPGEIPWGEIFWQNASSRTKKSLKCLLSLKNEAIKRHWIGEVASLYLKEFGSPNVSKLSKSSENDVIQNSSSESITQSTHLIAEETEVLNIPNYLRSHQTDYSLKDLNDHDTNAESTFLNKNSFETASSSTSNFRFYNEASNSHYQPLKCDLTFQPDDSLFKDLNKREIGLPVELKERKLSNPNYVKTNANDFQNSHINIDSIPTMVSKSFQPPENKKTIHMQPPFETELSQTDIPQIILENINHASIKALTESIKQLVTSVERLTQQNKSNIYNKTNLLQSLNSCHDQQIHSDTDEISSSQPSCAAHCSTNTPSPSSPKENSQNDSVRCSSFHCRHQCCNSHNKYNMKSLHSCHSRAYTSPFCHCSSNKQLAYSENHTLRKSPHIMIPLQNISDGVLLKIVSILKTEYKSG